MGRRGSGVGVGGDAEMETPQVFKALAVRVHQAAEFVLVEDDGLVHEVVVFEHAAVLAEREHVVEVVLLDARGELIWPAPDVGHAWGTYVEQMPGALALKETAHEAVRHAREVQDAPLSHHVAIIGIVLDVANGLFVDRRDAAAVLPVSGGGSEMAMGIVEVIGRAPQAVHLDLAQDVVGQLGEQPVDHEAALDAALRVQDEDYLFARGVQQRFLDHLVRVAHVLGRVAEVALDHALDEVEDEAVGRIVDPRHLAPEYPRQPVDIGLEPVLAAAMVRSLTTRSLTLVALWSKKIRLTQRLRR